MDFIKDQWELIKETVRTEYNITDISFTTWINPLTLHSVENNTVYIVIPSDKNNAFSYISNKYKTFFQVTISELVGENLEVVFIMEKEASSMDSKNGEVTIKSPVYNINYENANLNPKYVNSAIWLSNVNIEISVLPNTKQINVAKHVNNTDDIHVIL